jgi:hypothetical protein
MAQHFLLSAAARSLSPAKVMRMSDRGAENVFVRLRWPETDGKPVCPNCGCQVCYDCRRSTGQARWRCKACSADFSVTSGTLFAWHKLPLRRLCCMDPYVNRGTFFMISMGWIYNKTATHS